MIDPFLDYQATKLQALLSKIQPCDYETLNGTRVQPLRIAGILKGTPASSTSSGAPQKQQSANQEVSNFFKEMQKQQEGLEALMKAFDDFIKRRLLEQFKEIFCKEKTDQEIAPDN